MLGSALQWKLALVLASHAELLAQEQSVVLISSLINNKTKSQKTFTLPCRGSFILHPCDLCRSFMSYVWILRFLVDHVATFVFDCHFKNTYRGQKQRPRMHLGSPAGWGTVTSAFTVPPRVHMSRKPELGRAGTESVLKPGCSVWTTNACPLPSRVSFRGSHALHHLPCLVFVLFVKKILPH